jgi:hypothetical protein
MTNRHKKAPVCSWEIKNFIFPKFRIGSLIGDVVAQWGCDGSVWGCGGSVGMWWLRGDVVARRGCGGSVGMWWLSGGSVRGCGGSVLGMWWLSGDVVAQLGDVVAQLAKARLGEPDCNAAVRPRLPPQSPEGRPE